MEKRKAGAEADEEDEGEDLHAAGDRWHFNNAKRVTFAPPEEFTQVNFTQAESDMQKVVEEHKTLRSSEYSLRSPPITRNSEVSSRVDFLE